MIDPEFKSSSRNRKDLLKIADQLDAIARNFSLTGEQLRKEIEVALKTDLRGPGTTAESKAFDEIRDLLIRFDDEMDDDTVRQKIAECASLVRHHLGE